MSICLYKMNGGTFDDIMEFGVLDKYNCAFNNLLTVVTLKIPDYIIFHAHNPKDINLEIHISTDGIHLISVHCTNTKAHLSKVIVFNADLIHSDGEIMQSFKDWFKDFEKECACKSSVFFDNKPFSINTPLTIKKVIFNKPATIVLWSDGTKTVVKCAVKKFDKEKGLAMAITKKFLGNKGNYYNEVRKWLEEAK